MKNHLREKYKAQEPVIGTFFNMGDMSCMECLGYAGMDFVIIDTEHGRFDRALPSYDRRVSETGGSGEIRAAGESQVH